MTEPSECLWDVDDLQLAGLSWGPKDGIPVLALHGWMDHADSFRVLAPLLTGCRVVALDLSGQGLSSHRAAHATYNIWDDLPQIVGVLDQLGWNDCVLLGHSRGAIIGSLLAAAVPERVRAIVALDALVPDPTEATVVETLRAFLQQTKTQMSRPPRIFATRREYAKRRSAQGNSAATSQALADRALEELPDGYRMRADPRLFASSAVKLTQAQVEDVLRAIRCPVLNIWASEGIRHKRERTAKLARLAEAVVPSLETVDLPGDHHFHLDPDGADTIARAVMEFLARHHVA